MKINYLTNRIKYVLIVLLNHNGVFMTEYTIVEISDATELEELQSMYSDFYKEVHGIRPRWVRLTSIAEAEHKLAQLREEAVAIQESEAYWDKIDAERDDYVERMGLVDEFIGNKYEIMAGEPA